jgi:hypothetical protein
MRFPVGTALLIVFTASKILKQELLADIAGERKEPA